MSPLVAQTFETSSIAISASSVPVPRPPYCSSKSNPKMSFSRKSSTTSHGNSCDSSISAARGAIRSRAIWRTRSRNSRCSGVRRSHATRGIVRMSGGRAGRTMGRNRSNERSSPMRRMLALLAIGAATVSALATSAGAAPPSVQVLIRHQVRGCHSWSVNSNAYTATQRLTVAPGTKFTFTDNDVMPHQLVQLSGPTLRLHGAKMHTMGAQASLQLLTKGHYVFGTKVGEDYMKGVKTTGEDNVLKLVVTVK